MTHKCPIDDCRCVMPQHILMCRKHWALVPSILKNRVYAGWNRGKITPDYVAARTEAIRSVNLLTRGGQE